MTFTFVRDLAIGLTAGTIFFLFFAGFALVSSLYLWVRRDLFWVQGGTPAIP